LRHDLDFMLSPAEDRPGLLIRDNFRYSDAMVIIPPALVACLECFDGRQTELDLRAKLVEVTGDFQVSDRAANLQSVLRESGFLQDETFATLKEKKEREFASGLIREPAHAGSGYPAVAAELTEQMDEWMGGPEPVAKESGLIAIAAPHVSPIGGWQSYRAAYGLLGPEYRDRTFVILGTSHYGEPDRFGLTRKAYRTPWGDARTDTGLVDELTRLASDAVATEDYCHAVEHSIEFQVVYLQSLYGPDIKIVPILCGSYARSIYEGGKPEDNDSVQRFLATLGEIGAREGSRLLWVLGIDMAHMGRRYGDRFEALSHQNEMLAVGGRDKQRIERMAAGDARGFWELVQENRDDLKWCGSSPVYTFLKVKPEARGSLKRYEQWNIEPDSVVSFAGMSFT
jgi:AmmeMemoRadiSam system protein B